jgi:ABC-type amino acid transport substrate-binding protein
MRTHDLPRAAWRKSTYSGTNGNCVEVAVVPAWQTSSYSGTNGACVEVARNLAEAVAVRDSKDRSGPVLAFAPHEWRAFIAAVKEGEFDQR